MPDGKAAMSNLRTYGEPPFGVAVIHGGPGAGGEMAPVARVLAYDDSDGSWIAAITTVDDHLLFYRYDPNAPAPGIELLRSHTIGDIQGSPAMASSFAPDPGVSESDTVYLPTRDGLRAFDMLGQPVAGWPPRPGGAGRGTPDGAVGNAAGCLRPRSIRRVRRG